MSHQLPAILFLLPLFAAISMPVVCLKHRHWSQPISVAILAAMVLVSILNLHNVIHHGEVRYVFSGWTAPLGIEWVADGLASVILVLVSALSLLGVVFAGATSPKGLGGLIVHYHTLILLLVSSMTGIVFAGDLFNLFVFLEVAAISSYALIGVAGGRALFAAFRYLILGTLGASLFLLGVSYLYAVTGTLNMSDMVDKLPLLLSSKALAGGLLFMFIGLGIKMALVPFHSWLPEAYTYAPDSISPILASLVTKVALLAWVRIIYWVFNASIIINGIPILLLVEVVGALAAVIGASLALAQRNIKMMFAYGGISHIGIILIDQFLRQHFIKILDSVDQGMTTVDSEREELSFDHTELGAFIAEKSNFAEPIIVAIRYHHTPDEYEGPHQAMLDVVTVANYLASRQGIGSLGSKTFTVPSDQVYSRLGMKKDQLEEIWSQLEPTLDSAATLASL